MQPLNAEGSSAPAPRSNVRSDPQVTRTVTNDGDWPNSDHPICRDPLVLSRFYVREAVERREDSECAYR
jgi:hypothetical protein